VPQVGITQVRELVRQCVAAYGGEVPHDVASRRLFGLQTPDASYSKALNLLLPNP